MRLQASRWEVKGTQSEVAELVLHSDIGEHEVTSWNRRWRIILTGLVGFV